MSIDSNGAIDLDKAHQNLTNTSSSSEYKKPSNIIDAISKIQQYHVFEKDQEKDINKNFFTLRQFIDFSKIGFKNGFIEGFLFVTMLPFFQTIYPSFKIYFLHSQYTEFEHLLYLSIAYIPIVFVTIWLSTLSRLYDGAITKKAIFGLLLGRTTAFFLKGILIYFLLSYLYNLAIYDKDSTYLAIDKINNGVTWLFHFDVQYRSDDLYEYYYVYIVPAINKIAHEAAYSMMFFALVPFVVVISKGLYVNFNRRNSEILYEEY
jgi:hypothetical protein